MKRLIFTMLIFFTAYSSQATIYYVDSSSTASAPTGTSWATAFPLLTTAITTANSLDTIWVAKGTYAPGITRTSEFEVANNHIFGGFAGNETSLSQRNISANPTILTGDLTNNDNNNIVHTESSRSDNAYTVVSIRQIGNDCTLDGFIIEGGNANNWSPGRARYGGGIYIVKTSTASFSGVVKIQNCIIRKNTAVYTAAVYSHNASSDNSPMRIIFNKCRIENNRAIGTIMGQFAQNRAIEHFVFNSLITKNETNNGTIFGMTSRTGLYKRAHLSLMNNTIVDNIANGQSPISGLVRFYCENGNDPVGNLCMANNIMMDDSVNYTIEKATGQLGTLEGVYFGRNLYPDSVNNGNAVSIVRDTNYQYYGTAGDKVAFRDAPNGDFELTYCDMGIDAGTVTAPANATAFITNFYNVYTNNAGAEDLNNGTRQVNDIDFGCYENQGVVFDLNFNGSDLLASTGLTNYTWKRNSTTISGANTATYSPTQNGNYEVTAEDADGCEHKATYNLNNLAVQDFATANLKMYPNPVLNLLYIDGDVSEIKIYDLSGKLLVKTPNKEINVASLAKGIYILKAGKEGQYYQSKFVKE